MATLPSSILTPPSFHRGIQQHSRPQKALVAGGGWTQSLICVIAVTDYGPVAMG